MYHEAYVHGGAFYLFGRMSTIRSKHGCGGGSEVMIHVAGS